MAISSEQAEVIAIKALEWLSATDDLLMTFLGSTGMDLNDLKTGASDSGVLAGILDFILMDDEWVRGFSEFAEIPLSAPYEARQALPGGEQMHWT